MFPLVAREGGVLIRAGHTEASVDLARLAGLYPAAVICEIMNDDGTMARMPDLVAFAQRHGLKIGTIEDLIAYRLRNEHLVRARRQDERGDDGRQVRSARLRDDGRARASIWRWSKAISRRPARCWCACTPSTLLGDLLGVGEAGEGQIANSLRMIEKEGRGVVVLIRDLRPKSVSDWISGRLQSAKPVEGARERRQVEIGVGSQILSDLGVRDMVLLTNSPAQVYVGLEGFGLRIVGTRGIE